MSVELTNNAHIATNKSAITVFEPSADESETYHDNDDDDANHENEELNGLLGDETLNTDAELIKGEDAQQKGRFMVITTFLVALVIGGVLTLTLGIGGIKKKIASSAVHTPPIVNPPTNEVQVENSRKQVQVANYINGSALIISIHITHHAGTSVCAMMKKLGPSPSFACMSPGKNENDADSWPANTTNDIEIRSWPMSKFVPRFRPYYHFMSWEYQTFAHLHRTNWEYDNLVSMIVMRDPMRRFLAGGKCGGFQRRIPDDPTNETQDLYWEYANSDCVDNFALRVLAPSNTCGIDGADTNVTCVEGAKALLRRFTFILDQECLNDSMVALGDALNLNITREAFEGRLHHHKAQSVLLLRERFGNDTLYEYVRHRFRRDIELYEWSKTRSIVKC